MDWCVHKSFSNIYLFLSTLYRHPIFYYFSLFPFRSVVFFSNTNQRTHHITSLHISHSTNNIKRNYTHTLTHLHIKLIHQLNKSNFRQKFMRVSHCFTWIEIFLFQISVTRCENANVCSASKATNIQFNVETKRKKIIWFYIACERNAYTRTHWICLIVCVSCLEKKSANSLKVRARGRASKTRRKVTRRSCPCDTFHYWIITLYYYYKQNIPKTHSGCLVLSPFHAATHHRHTYICMAMSVRYASTT